MKTLLFVPILAVVAWLANPMPEQNLAQQKGKGKGGQFGGGFAGGQLRLLENADVQKDLKLSDAQVKTVGELSQKQKDAMKEAFGGGKGKADFEKIKELATANKKAIADLLTSDQAKRLTQLELQAKGPRAFLDKKVAEDLGLKEEQTTKIKETVTEAGKKTSELRKDAKENPDNLKKIAEINKNTTTDIVKSLSSDQQTKWNELSGPAFTGTFPTTGFRGAGTPFGNNFKKKKKKDV